jgi:hypothetical protein
MIDLGKACPEFHVRTPNGTVGAADFRGEWLGILHCTRPCTPGCGTCMQGFDSLASRLRERGCRLLVALDEPDATIRALMARRAATPGPTWTLGTWEGPAERSAGTTRFIVVDQGGTVRAMAETPGSGPIRGQMLLDLVDRACGHPIEATVEQMRPDVTLGCVEWFDFEGSRH